MDVSVFFLLIFTVSFQTFAEDCSRGDLDPRFCDRNGDMVADASSEGERSLNPRVLIFAYTPVEDPAVYRDVWSEFLDHLSGITGLRVVFSLFNPMRRKLKRCDQVGSMWPGLIQARHHWLSTVQDLSLSLSWRVLMAAMVTRWK